MTVRMVTQEGADVPLKGNGTPTHVRETAPERVVYPGRVFEVVELDVEERGRPKTFERARRAPGTRVIVRDDEGRLLLTREWRHELSREDLRLPGGKVFDTLAEFKVYRAEGSGSLVEAAEGAAVRELREEAGLNVTELELLSRSVCGATIDWDLYYFVARSWTVVDSGQQLEPGEEIVATWVSPEEAIKACLDGVISEERSALVLLRLLMTETT